MSSSSQSAKIYLALAQLSVFNVGARRKPANNLSRFIPQRLAANQKPTILSVFSANASLDFPTLTAPDRIFGPPRNALCVLGMERPYLKILCPKVIQRKAKELEQVIVR